MSHFDVFVFTHIYFICSTSYFKHNNIILIIIRHSICRVSGTPSLLHLGATNKQAHTESKSGSSGDNSCGFESESETAAAYIYMRQFFSWPQNMATKQFCTILLFVSMGTALG